MNNVKQITNYDVENLNTEIKSIVIDGVGVSKEYKIIDEETLGGKTFQLAYYCKDRFRKYPIYIIQNNIETRFNIGETGILEFQPEIFIEDGEEVEAKIWISEIKVPSDIEFTIDYYINI